MIDGLELRLKLADLSLPRGFSRRQRLWTRQPLAAASPHPSSFFAGRRWRAPELSRLDDPACIAAWRGPSRASAASSCWAVVNGAGSACGHRPIGRTREYRHRLGVRQLTFDENAPFARAVRRFADRLQLQLRILNCLQIRLLLRRQAARRGGSCIPRASSPAPAAAVSLPRADDSRN